MSKQWHRHQGDLSMNSFHTRGNVRGKNVYETQLWKLSRRKEKVLSSSNIPGSNKDFCVSKKDFEFWIFSSSNMGGHKLPTVCGCLFGRIADTHMAMQTLTYREPGIQRRPGIERRLT